MSSNICTLNVALLLYRFKIIRKLATKFTPVQTKIPKSCGQLTLNRKKKVCVLAFCTVNILTDSLTPSITC